MTAYLLRSISPDLWRQVKAQAERDGHSLRYVLLTLLRVYVERGMPPHGEIWPAYPDRAERGELPK